MRISKQDFRQKPLQVQAFLSDVPLHDVWAIHLRGGGDGRRLRDLEVLLSFEGMQKTNRAIAALFKLRWALGRFLSPNPPREGVWLAS